MAYVVEYSVCALAFLLAIIWRYFTTQQFPSYQSRLFRLVLVFALLDIVLDLVGSFTMPRATELPYWINYATNIIFYSLQLVIPVILLCYVQALAGFGRKSIRWWQMAPAALFLLLVLTDPLHSLIFYIDPGQGYTRGPLFNSLYGCCGLYIVAAVVAINVLRKRISAKQYATIMIFIGIVMSAVVVQFLYPRYLLTGPAMALAITMMYLTIQKPEDLLDTLTGTFNRTALMLTLDDLLTSKKPFQLILITLSRVQRLDRLMGYASMNRTLGEIGRFLAFDIDRCWAYRHSGTRFIVITRRPADYEKALQKIRDRFKKPWLPNEYALVMPLTLCRIADSSIFSSTEELAELIVDAAEQAAEGADVEVGEAALQAMNRRAQVEAALAQGIEQDLLEVYFQPIYCLRTGRFSYAEALLRFPWQGSMISPAEFIPVAEQNGMILRIDELVVKKVCFFIKEYNPARLGLERVSINLSAMEFVRADLAEVIGGIVEESGVAPEQITFEMTETAASGPFPDTQRSMQSLVLRGFRFALDDYGTGFANITQVVRLPFDVAKIDRSILTARDAGGRTVLQSSVYMFRDMGITTVVEGAETVHEVDRLKELGVDFIQGYYYSKPLPVKHFVEFLKENNLEK